MKKELLDLSALGGKVRSVLRCARFWSYFAIRSPRTGSETSSVFVPVAKKTQKK